MPATYEPIATTTLGSAASTITFSSIPSTYTDLRLVLVATASSANTAYPRFRFNGDTGTNFSNTTLKANGTTAASDRDTSQTSLILGPYNYVALSTTIPTFGSIDIFSYAGSTNKTCLTISNNDLNGSGEITARVGLWRSTSAITSIDILGNGGNFAAGTTATLYGIKAA